jgi:hypothetical protein
MKRVATSISGLVIGAWLAAPAEAQSAPPALASIPVATATPTPAPAAEPPSVKAVLQLVQDACLPLLRGGQASQIARTVGLRMQDGVWVQTLQAGQQVQLQPPDVANPHLCSVTATYAAGAGGALRQALGAWASSQVPPLVPVKVEQSYAGAMYDRLVSTWSAQTPAGAEGVVLDQEKTLQGKPASGNLGQTSLLVSLTPTTTTTRTASTTPTTVASAH